DPPPASAEYVEHPPGRSSSCGLAALQSRRRRRSTTPSSVRLAVARTTAPARWLPFLTVPALLAGPARDSTSPLSPDAAVEFPLTPLSRCPQKLSVELPGDNRNL